MQGSRHYDQRADDKSINRSMQWEGLRIFPPAKRMVEFLHCKEHFGNHRIISLKTDTVSHARHQDDNDSNISVMLITMESREATIDITLQRIIFMGLQPNICSCPCDCCLVAILKIYRNCATG